MAIEVCNGCDQCGLRCAEGVPCTRSEFEILKQYVATLSEAEKCVIEQITQQDKSVSLGDDVSVTMCRYRDMNAGRCSVYSARPLVCRLLGHVEWMPCPIEKVPHTIKTHDALELMRHYAGFERKTFEEWDAESA